MTTTSVLMDLSEKNRCIAADGSGYGLLILPYAHRVIAHGRTHIQSGEIVPAGTARSGKNPVPDFPKGVQCWKFKKQQMIFLMQYHGS